MPDDVGTIAGHPVTMSIFMDDVPAGTADEAVENGIPAGDCLRASVATVLGLQLEEVPHFVQYIKHPAGTDPLLWWWALVGFCHAHGWDVSFVKDEIPKGWALASGMSPRGHYHVVVAFNGFIIWDPHPSRAGVEEVDEWFKLERSA